MRRKISYDARATTRTHLVELLKREYAAVGGSMDASDLLALSSLQAMQLSTRLSKQLEIGVSPLLLLNDKTIDYVAASLLTQLADSMRHIRLLNSTGKRSPLFLVPGLGGDIEIFRELAGLLDGERLVYAFVPPGKEDGAFPRSSIPEIAALYAAELGSVYKAGRCNIFGWCSGGIVAFELAVRLQKADREIGMFGALDANWPRAIKSEQSPPRPSLLKILQRKDPVKVLQNQIKKVRRTFDCNLAGLLNRLSLPIPERIAVDLHRNSEIRALKRYAPRESLVGDMALYWSSLDPDWDWIDKGKGRLFNSDEALPNWRMRVSGQVELLEVPGDHISSFQPPNLEFFAALLRKRLI